MVFSVRLWKALTPANISRRFLFLYLHSGCCLSRLPLSVFCMWMSSLLLRQVMPQQVSLRLSILHLQNTICVRVCVYIQYISIYIYIFKKLYYLFFLQLRPLFNCYHHGFGLNGIHFLLLLFEPLVRNFSLQRSAAVFPTRSPLWWLRRRERPVSIVYSQSLDSVPSDQAVLDCGGGWGGEEWWGEMDTLTFHTLKCGSARYYL